MGSLNMTTKFSFALAAASMMTAAASANITCIDFETDDDLVTPLVNGQAVDTPLAFGNLFNLSSSGNNQGAAMFDSSPTGPNQFGGDQDLLVGLGNVLILQSNDDATQTNPGIFDIANDSAKGGSLVFDFLAPVQMGSMDVVDIDGSVTLEIILTDSNGLTRVFDVTEDYTYEATDGIGNGYDAVDFTTLGVQIGEAGGTATGSEDAGFDINDVVSLEIMATGSAAFDNICFTQIPAPGALALMAVCIGFPRRRRH